MVGPWPGEDAAAGCLPEELDLGVLSNVLEESTASDDLPLFLAASNADP